MKIQSVVFPEADSFRLQELNLEDPGPGDITVKTLVSAISPGTERWILRGKHIGTSFPCVPGYHRIGRVEACGEEVSGFEPGDIVYGSGNRWKEPVRSMWGAHVSDSVSTPDGYRFVSPETPGDFELRTLVFTILAGVAVRGVRKLGRLYGKKMLIIGGGFIGLCAAQLARLEEAVPVIADADPERVEFGSRFAAAVLTGNGEAEDALKRLCPEGFDILHDTAGAPEATNKLLGHVKRGGTLLLQAQYFDPARCAIDLDAVKVKEITVRTTCGVGPLDWSETFSMIRSRTLRIDDLITHRFDSSEILKGYEILHAGREFNLGIVFDWAR